MNRVLHIVPVNTAGQIPIFVANQLDSLHPPDHNSEFITFSGSNFFGVPLSETFFQVIQLIKSIRSYDGQIIHAHWGSILGFLTSLSVGKKYFILTLRGSDVNPVKSERKLFSLIRIKFTRMAIKRADHVIFVSEKLRDKVKNPSLSFSIIPDGTPLDIFYPKNNKESSAITISQKRLIAFYCGGRPVDKNLPLALEVFHRVKAKIENLELIVIENTLNQHEMADLLSLSSALLVTSLSEGSPNIVREAIASNCPVVSVDVGDAKFWIDRCNAGIVCTYDPNLLASGLVKVISDKPKIFLNRAKEFSLETSASRINQIYNKAASTK